MVHGKFEGPVVREQGQTRLQTTFVNGEKAGDWSEPGAARTPTPKAKEQSAEPTETEPIETPQIERPSPSPTLTPSPSPKPTPSPTPTPKPSPIATPTPTPRLTPSPTPTPIPVASPSLTPSPKSTATPTPTPTLKPSPIATPTLTLSPSLLQLASPPPSSRKALEETPSSKPSATSPSVTAIPKGVVSKDRMVADFKEQTESVMAQVNDATANFREIDRLDAVAPLPASVSASVASLAQRARDFRAKLGYEIAFHESKVETETVDALTVVDQIKRSLAGENAPAARMTLSNFLKRYPEPPADNRKPLWRYLTSASSLCHRLKKEAGTHLKQAQSLESTGKKTEALREYQEIYRIYPNPITQLKIQQLEGQPRSASSPESKPK